MPHGDIRNGGTHIELADGALGKLADRRCIQNEGAAERTGPSENEILFDREIEDDSFPSN